MAETYDLLHLRLVGREETFDYKFPGMVVRGELERPPRDRAQHADKLRRDLDAAQLDAKARGLETADGLALTYELQPHAIEVVDSLERTSSGIQLLSVVKLTDRIRAVVLVPAGKRRIVDAVLNRYANELHPKSGRPKGQDLVENIDAIRLASELDLWTDNSPFPKPDTNVWWEVWLHNKDIANANQTWTSFVSQAGAAGFRTRDRYVTFPDRVVGVMFGCHRHWESQPSLFLRVAELRLAKELPTDYFETEAKFQRELNQELLARLTAPLPDHPAVCILDTGVSWGHPLLRIALSERDAQAATPSWGSSDNGSHGTSMAGIALFGTELADVLTASMPVTLEHRLESVKILPPTGANEPDLYGSLTQDAVALAELAAPNRSRTICLAVTADARDGGAPSSWSAALDDLCFGGEMFGEPKLACVSAGNLRDEIFQPDYRYPVIQGELCGVEDPAQAWNVITVGAMTQRVIIQDPDFKGYEPIAPSGDLCPTSRTSLAWADARGWPIKPDIVMEGGNWATTTGGQRDAIEDLGLLSTAVRDDGRLFTIARDTSAATAAAARLAAQLMAVCSEFWPETVRGLMVHSAEWTEAMKRRFPGNAKHQIQSRLRCFGYGQPSLERATRSAANHVVLIYEGTLTPYKKEDSEVKSNEMHLHDLPWPVEVLERLGDESVTMRVTLSYFVQSTPGRRGWTRRHRYASHGLRFDLQKPAESRAAFLRRVSDAALDDTEESVDVASGDSLPWVVGRNGRSQGSLHCDWWSGTAVELASCRHLAVYPVTGWWRERGHFQRWKESVRYSLIVSIQMSKTDIYSAISNELAVSVSVAR